MSGFLQRFFRRKPLPGESETNRAKPAKTPKESQAYFLDPDEAQSYGDIDYMRTSKTVRKTFLGGKIEVIEEISAKEKRVREERGMGKSIAESSTPSAEANTSTPSSSIPTERRRSGSEMDRFRNMAKDINRKG